ncbi:MAG: efflux RND transporter permease subunit [Planctomycetes bacterium]|nr:efflux RND transporter permease subunit [Planctomycetota bacterium]
MSIRRPVTTVMVICALLIFGVIGFFRLGIALMPDVDFPIVSVGTSWRNSTPEQVEISVTKPIEAAIGQLEGVKHITSSNRRGSSRVTVEFELSRDIESATQDVRDAVSRASHDLPDDVDPPTISKYDVNAQPIMMIAVYGDLPVTEIRQFAEETIAPRLQQKPGVGSIDVGGGRTREIRIWLYRDKLKQYGITIQDVINALKTENLEMPGGKVETNVQELVINTKGRIDNARRFNDIVITYREGTSIKISDVGYAEDGMNDMDSIVRFVDPAGAERLSIGMRVSPQTGANQVAVARAIREEIENTRKILPKGMYMDIAFDNSVFIERAINDVNMNLVVGAILASLVILLFLQNIGTAVISALAIPTSIIATFGFMYFMGFTLNTLTMLGLALAVGIVIDDAIIIVENIYRHREEGKGMLEAAKDGASEISFAAMAATFALLGIFLPVAFMSGLIGRFFYEFGMTMAFSIFISLVVALTLTPMLSSRYLKVGVARFFLFKWFEALMNGSRRLYTRVIAVTLKYSITTIVAAIILFIGSVWLVRNLGVEFQPQEDQSRFMVRIETPIDYSVLATEQVTRKVVDIVKGIPEVEYFMAATGGFGGSANSGSLNVTLKDRRFRTRSQFEIMADVRRMLSKIPDAAVSVSEASGGAPGGGGRGGAIQYVIQGPDLAVLDRATNTIMEELKKTHGFVDVDRDLRIGKPELQVKIDRERAAEMGISAADISGIIGVSFGGLEVGDYTEGGKTYKVRVKAVDSERRTIKDISDISIRSAKGEVVDMTNIIDVKPSIGPNMINRTDRERSVTLSANLEGLPLGDAIAQMEAISKKVLPPGYYGRRSGSSEMFGDAYFSIIFALVLALIFSYMILAAQFENFIHPFSITLSLPLAVVGALGFLWFGANVIGLSGMTINIMFMIGVILLVGLAKKNAILLIDYTDQLRKSGLSRDDALKQACPVRLRPILMTSITTIAATIPVIIGLGEGSESRRPMAIAIFGGIVTSTLLTLVVIPSVYRIFDIILTKFHLSRESKKQ